MSEFACVDETHYLHIGDNADGEPCNSSVSLASDQGFTDAESHGWWRCLGCGQWWRRMPKMEPEGLAALRRLRPRKPDGEP